MIYVLFAGVARRSDRRAALAGAVVAGESLIFAANGLRCPLTDVAEQLGAERGSVTDIYLPRWLAHTPACAPRTALIAAGYLHARNSASGSRPRGGRSSGRHLTAGRAVPRPWIPICS